MKKKSVSLLLIFALLIPCACFPAHADGEDALVGRWETEIDLASPLISSVDVMMNVMFAEVFGSSALSTISIGDYISSLPVSVYLAFHGDGTVESGLVNAERVMEEINTELEAAIHSYCSVLTEQMLPFILADSLGVEITSQKDLEEQLGMTLDEFCLENMGMSQEEAIKMSIEQAFPTGTDYLQELGLHDIYSVYEWEGEYAVEDGQIYFESDPDSCLYVDVPPYYEISRQGLSLYLSETKALKDMTLDEICALDDSLTVEDIIPAELDLSEEDSLRFVVGLLGLVYDLTYTRA